MADNHIVITGADGFIGRHLCAKLSQNGYKITAIILIDSPLRKNIENIPNIHIVEADFSRLEEYSDQIEPYPTAMLHLAWAGVTAQARDDLTTQMDNIKLCLGAVELAASIHAQKLIMPGSTMEYLYCGGAISGKDIPTPQNAYGAVKIAARYICQERAQELGIPFIYAILSGVYSEDRRDGNVVFYVIDTLLDGKKPSLTALDQKWDYIHIDDLVEALMLICQKGKDGKCYAVGHGDNMPLREYIKIIHNLIDPSLPLGIGEVPYKTTLLPQSCIDLTELQNDTGFVPAIPFEEGIQKVIAAVRLEKGEKR